MSETINATAVLFYERNFPEEIAFVRANPLMSMEELDAYEKEHPVPDNEYVYSRIRKTLRELAKDKERLRTHRETKLAKRGRTTS
jgi:hypothetical protein